MSRGIRKPAAALAGIAMLGALLAGCGGSDNGTASRNQPAPPASEFPAAQGKTLVQLLQAAGGGQGFVVSPAARNFHLGANRFPFGVFDPGHKAITDAQVAIYAAPGKGVNGPRSAPSRRGSRT